MENFYIDSNSTEEEVYAQYAQYYANKEAEEEAINRQIQINMHLDLLAADSGEQQYIITLKNKNDLNNFYNDMETIGGDSNIPDRAVKLFLRRPISRSTEYLITKDEANKISNDDRVYAVVKKSDIEKLQPTYNTGSVNFFRGKSDHDDNEGYAFRENDNDHINWGLLRHTESSNRDRWTNWSTLYYTYRQYASSLSLTPDMIDDVTITSSGKNVDVVIVDGLIPSSLSNHPEYLDNQGNSRLQNKNWLADASSSIGGQNGTFEYLDEWGNYHGAHVAGTASGLYNGWARDANIYNLPALGDGSAQGSYDGAVHVWDMLRYFHNNKPINPKTGRRNPTITNHSYGTFWKNGLKFGDFGVVTNSSGTVKDAFTSTGALYKDITLNASGSGYAVDNRLKIPGTLLGGVSPENDLYFGIESVDANGGVVSLYSRPAFDSGTDPVRSGGPNAVMGMAYRDLATFPGDERSYTNVTTQNVTTADHPGFETWSMGSGSGCTVDVTIRNVDYNVSYHPTKVRYRGVDYFPSQLPSRYGNRFTRAEFESFGIKIKDYEVHLGLNSGDRNTSLGRQGSFYSLKYPVDSIWMYAHKSFYTVASGMAQTQVGVSEEIDDCLDDGIIIVSAAGNEKGVNLVKSGHPDYDNYIEHDYLLTLFGNNNEDFFVLRYRTYYRRATGTHSVNERVLVTGNMDSVAFNAADLGNYKDSRDPSSDMGERIDVWAAGEDIVSAYTAEGTVTHPQNSSYKIGNISGTSMASPQVAGVLAMVAEYWPNMTQEQAREWLINNSSYDQLTSHWDGELEATSNVGGTNYEGSYPVGSPYWMGSGKDIGDAPNRILTWKNIRPVDKQVFPNNIFPPTPKPTSGRTYPRPRIRRRG